MGRERGPVIPLLLAAHKRRLLGPLSVGTDDDPRGATVRQGFPQKSVILGSFARPNTLTTGQLTPYS